MDKAARENLALFPSGIRVDLGHVSNFNPTLLLKWLEKENDDTTKDTAKEA